MLRGCVHLRRDVDGLWSAFLSYLEAATGDDEEELAALEEKLREVKQKLADKHYLQGDAEISAADLALVWLPCKLKVCVQQAMIGKHNITKHRK